LQGFESIRKIENGSKATWADFASGPFAPDRAARLAQRCLAQGHTGLTLHAAQESCGVQARRLGTGMRSGDGDCAGGCTGSEEARLRHGTTMLRWLQPHADRKTARSLISERSGRRRAATATSSPVAGEEGGGGTAMAAELDDANPRLAAHGDNEVRCGRHGGSSGGAATLIKRDGGGALPRRQGRRCCGSVSDKHLHGKWRKV
jgi:hypothetical protein